MKLKTLSTAIVFATLPMTGAFAAAMDRSGQSVSAFLQPGNYVEAGLLVLDPNVSGTDTAGRSTGDMASSYHSAFAAIKVQATDNISVGLLFDQPFGAKADYDLSSPAFSSNGQGTSAEVTTENLTLLFGYQPNESWNFYAGPAWQQVKGNVHLRGTAYSAFNGYDATMKKKDAWGWVAGAAYQIPEIALKASLTYRSEIKHDLDSQESFGSTSVQNQMIGTLIAGGYPPSAAAAAIGTISAGTTNVKTPQSVNLDFQTGIMEDTIAFANVRWVNWNGFAIRPTSFGQAIDKLGTALSRPSLNGANLVEYTKDQWTINTGIGRKFTEKWSASASVGWDSGAGDPVTTLGPTKGYWSLGLGGQYSPAKDYFVQAGVRYFWLGDTQALTASSDNVGQFKDNHALGYSLKLGYRF